MSTATSESTLTRFNDIANDIAKEAPPRFVAPILPAIDWGAVGQQAPAPIPIGNRWPNDPLPLADWVVITWTSAEWQALDHVFLNASATGDANREWRNNWHPYTRGASYYTADTQSGTLWGLFQLVRVTDRSGRPWRVLLFKSNAHLAHSPWVSGLSEMMRCILTDTKADRVYTIGTAGGARLDQCLGDSVITNAATLKLQRPVNTTDNGNGSAFRSPDWYPATSLIDAVQEKLLMRLDTVVTMPALANLFTQLQAKHPGDPGVAALQLEDLLNKGLDPAALNKPKIQSLKDVPLLTTDFYYIADGNSADAFSFLEMDDAIIGREANAMGVRFACIRNISDPIVPDMTKTGVIIADNVRGDWSGLVYSNFGIYTSFNGALATWATIAGEGLAGYHPERSFAAPDANDPIEIKLVYEVRSCGTCTFFWPEDKHQAGYGPYTAFDFDVNVPYAAVPDKDAVVSPWVLGRTRPPSFPDGEISDGCRKAPIMTIGINPNLTAFAPGQNGAAWVYPNFSSDDHTNSWAKYAWYYRYRSVYQEKLSLDFVKKYILPEGKVTAARDGKLSSATRVDANPSWTIKVRYQGDADDTSIVLPGLPGDFPYTVFVDSDGPGSLFHAGDIIAGKLAVPAGIQVEILQAQQSYYMQFLPTLKQFQDYLVAKGHATANLRIGEDVSQLDMVACASPHWTEGYLGNQMGTIVQNCVSKNAWAVKQLVQTRPAILYIVSQASWDMFYSVVGKFVEPGKISPRPLDQSYTLLRETADPGRSVYLNFDFVIDDIPYKSRTRLVITPHFSFNTNFLPQYRMSPVDFSALAALPDFQAAILPANGFTILDADPAHPDYYREIQLQNDTAASARDTLKMNHPDLYNRLEPFYYNAHELMAAVMNTMYDSGELMYDDTKNYLMRTAGGCRFCVNQHWQFPNECRYGKPAEPPPPPGWLEKVADYIILNGKL